MLIITNWKALNINIDNDLTHEVKNGRLEDLFNVEDLGLDKEDLKQLKDGIVPQSVYRQILDALSSGFNDCASDPESYLYTSDFDVDQFTPVSYTHLPPLSSAKTPPSDGRGSFLWLVPKHEYRLAR